MSPYIFRYECAAKEYKVAVEGVSKGTEKGQQDERKTSEVSTPSIVTTFLVDEVWSLVSKKLSVKKSQSQRIHVRDFTESCNLVFRLQTAI